MAPQNLDILDIVRLASALEELNRASLVAKCHYLSSGRESSKRLPEQDRLFWTERPQLPIWAIILVERCHPSNLVPFCANVRGPVATDCSPNRNQLSQTSSLQRNFLDVLVLLTGDEARLAYLRIVVWVHSQSFKIVVL